MSKTYTIYLKDTDPDTGIVSQFAEIATAKIKKNAEYVVKALQVENSGGKPFGGDPNRDFYYE